MAGKIAIHSVQNVSKNPNVDSMPRPAKHPTWAISKGQANQ